MQIRRQHWLAGVILSVWLWLLAGGGAWADGQEELIKPYSYSNGELKSHNFAGQDLRASDFANANLEQANFSGADLRGCIFSASIMQEVNLSHANLTGAMLDSVQFTKADLRDAVFEDTILLRSTFIDSQITGTDFSNAILDGAQVKELCQTASGTNSQTGVATRESLGCKA